MNKRIILSIFLAALMLLIVSNNSTSASSRSRNPGRAPSRIEHDMGMVDLNALKDKKVSVTFWSSDNAASRMENIKNAAEAKNDPARKHIGVNIDDEPKLFQAYLLRDHLEDDTLQLRAEGDIARQLTDTYGYTTVYY